MHNPPPWGLPMLIRSFLPVPLFVTLASSALAAQEPNAWVLRIAGGYYDLHDSRETGAAASADIARRLQVFAIAFSVTQTLGTDDFTSFEFAVEAHPLLRGRVSPFVGAGAGLMLESGSASGPYFVQAGAEFRVAPRGGLRLLARRGWHGSFGDPGTFDGPHLFMVGWVHRL